MNKLRSPSPLLQRQFDAHTLWISSGGCQGARFNDNTDGIYDFRSLMLDGVDLSLGLLTSCDFTGSSLRNAFFIGSQCDGSTFENADISGATFDKANLEVAYFVRATFNRASFRDAKTELTIWGEKDIETVQAIFDAECDARGELARLITSRSRRFSDAKLDTFLRRTEALAITREQVRIREFLEFWRCKKIEATPLLRC